MPVATIASGVWLNRLAPLKVTAPEVACTTPDSALSRVVLPAPLAPIRVTRSPSSSLRETPLRALILP